MTKNQQALAVALAIPGITGAWIFDNESPIRDATGNSGDATLFSGGTPPTWALSDIGGSFDMHGYDGNGIVVPVGHVLHTPSMSIIGTLNPKSAILPTGKNSNPTNENYFYIPYAGYGGDSYSSVLLVINDDYYTPNSFFTPRTSRALNLWVQTERSSNSQIQTFSCGVLPNNVNSYLSGANPLCVIPTIDDPVTFLAGFDSTGFYYKIKSRNDYQTTFLPFDVAWDAGWGGGNSGGNPSAKSIAYGGDSITNLLSAEWGQNSLGGAMIDPCYNTFVYSRILSDPEFLSIANVFYADPLKARISMKGHIKMHGIVRL